MADGLTTLDGALGDIFWDLPPWITFVAGAELGTTIYVANPSDDDRQYALMAKLASGGQVISEESIVVFGAAWFKVDAGDWQRLRGALRFEESDCELSVVLYEKAGGQAIDAVSTLLISPTAAAAAWPPWPGATAPGAPSYDWSSSFGSMIPLMMMGIMGVVLVSALTRPAEKKEISAAA